MQLISRILLCVLLLCWPHSFCVMGGIFVAFTGDKPSSSGKDGFTSSFPRCILSVSLSCRFLRLEIPGLCWIEVLKLEVLTLFLILEEKLLDFHYWAWCLLWFIVYGFYYVRFSSVQSLSSVWLCDPMDFAHQASLSITNSQNLLKLMSMKSVMPSNHLILRCPLLLLPSIFPGIRVFSSESVLHIRWPKYWSFSFNISPSSEYLGLISFTID